MNRVWHLLTGEYPPDRGGIGDYTRLLARALADHGREVHVWTPSAVADHPEPGGVAVHAMGGVGRGALRRLGQALDRHPAPRRLLVQYAPQAWGMRGMNVPFARWLLARRHAGDDVRVMFHEPFFPFGWQRPRRNLLAAVNRVMAGMLLRASPRAYVSTAAWKPLLQPLGPRGLSLTTLPIPSTIPRAEGGGVAALRRRLAGDRPLVAHFGTYGQGIAPLLRPALRAVAGRRPEARILLLGDGGPAFATRLRAEARFPGALIAPGYLDALDLSVHLQAADAAIQPYADGADTRRTTLMACIANGVPTLTTAGRFTDAPWRESPLAFGDPARPAELGGVLLDGVLAADRAELGRRHREFYEGKLSLGKSVRWLLEDRDGPW